MSKPYLVIFQTENKLPSGYYMMPGQAREFLNSDTKTTGLRNEADCQGTERKKCPVLDSAEARKNTDNSPSLLRKIKGTEQVFALEEDRNPSLWQRRACEQRTEETVTKGLQTPEQSIPS